MKKLVLSTVAAAAAVAATGCAMRDTSASTTNAPSGPVYASTTSTGLIPSGTQVVIRTNEAIAGTKASAGQTYSAEVARDIVNQNGTTLVPNGSPARVSIVEMGGGTAGTSRELQLALQSVTVNGRTYNVTSDVAEQGGDRGLGTNRRTAEYVGGGALLGTVIGAIAGGGSGAAIGAAVGAAGGAATQVLTRGSEVRVPAETLITFQTERPIRLAGFQGNR
ncbi:MAG: hypothetical protein SFV54_28005 [Bryobacteraceae bacterium]|nr:hypothetical protein [Bryobacteraceae bacterium]